MKTDDKIFDAYHNFEKWLYGIFRIHSLINVSAK